MEVTYTKSAAKELRKIPSQKAEAIRRGMLEVAANPFVPDNNIKPMQDVKNGFRKRFGDYRALYTVDAEVQILEVYKVGKRGDVYK